MPAQAQIVVTDGKATPLTHTFNVMGAVSQAGEVIGSWINRSASTLTGGAELVKSYFRTKADGSFSHRVATVMPITEMVGGVQVVTRVLKATTTYDIPANATAIERKDIRVLHRNIAASVGVFESVDDAGPSW